MAYRYTLDVLTETGRPLEHVVLTPDWTAALEWTHFEGIREGRLPAVTRTGSGDVEPVWDARHGEPYVSGFRVTVRARTGGAVTREIPKTYLRGVVQEISADLVTRGVLETGSMFRWVVSAFATQGRSTSAAPADDLFDVEEVAQALPVDPAPFATFARDAAFAGDDDERLRHVPVLLPRAILAEATALATAAGDLETGGILVGTLHRDTAVSGAGLFVEVTAQVPAPHTRSESTKLTFTGETWAAVRTAIALRRRDELMLGWWHYHPDWCRLRNCPPERRRECTAASPFFSAEDVHLHATCFPSGYQVALLMSDSTAAGGLTSSVFGWWEGQVVARGFHVLDREHALRTKEGEPHAARIAP